MSEWLFDKAEPAQEGAITKWMLNRAKHTGMKSRISTEQRKALKEYHGVHEQP